MSATAKFLEGWGLLTVLLLDLSERTDFALLVIKSPVELVTPDERSDLRIELPLFDRCKLVPKCLSCLSRNDLIDD